MEVSSRSSNKILVGHRSFIRKPSSSLEPTNSLKVSESVKDLRIRVGLLNGKSLENQSEYIKDTSKRKYKKPENRLESVKETVFPSLRKSKATESAKLLLKLSNQRSQTFELKDSQIKASTTGSSINGLFLEPRTNKELNFQRPRAGVEKLSVLKGKENGGLNLNDQFKTSNSILRNSFSENPFKFSSKLTNSTISTENNSKQNFQSPYLDNQPAKSRSRLNSMNIPSEEAQVEDTKSPVDKTQSLPVSSPPSFRILGKHRARQANRAKNSNGSTKVVLKGSSKVLKVPFGGSSPETKCTYYLQGMKALFNKPISAYTRQDHQYKQQYLDNIRKLIVMERDSLADPEDYLKKIRFRMIYDEPETSLPARESSSPLLVLDMDETLVYRIRSSCQEDPSSWEGLKIHTVTFQQGGSQVAVQILLRPGLTQFLEALNRHFRLYVFTAGEANYARALLKLVDPERRYIQKIFDRRFCSRTKNDLLVKDLRLFTPDCRLSNLFLVDNSVSCFFTQPENGVPVLSFEGDPRDKELSKLQEYLLEEVLRQDNMIEFNSNYFSLQKWAHEANSMGKILC